MVATYYCQEEVQLHAVIQQENDMTQIKARKSICSHRLHLKAEFHGQVHARADRLKNKLYGSTLNSMRDYGGTIC